jgi:hypothetical protein
MTLETQNRNALGFVRWWILGPCLVAVALGLGVLLIKMPTETKHFLAGLFLGIGAGGAIAEITATFERRDTDAQMAQLRAPLLGDCRLAYRLGEFVFPFYAALSRNEPDDRHVTEVQSLAETLGIGKDVERSIEQANKHGASEFPEYQVRFQLALSFKGAHTLAFYALGSDLFAIRGPDAKSDREARASVATKIRESLSIAKQFAGDCPTDTAWERFMARWEGGKLSENEIDDALMAFHGFHVGIGLDGPTMTAFEATLANLAAGKAST